MAVFRINKTENYTVMSNYHLRDRELSCKACGLLSKMLSLPDEWDYTSKGLAYICKDGIDSVNSALKELEERGYLVRRRLRKENGQLGDIEYTIYERPQVEPQGENPIVVEPEDEKSEGDFPEQENPVLVEEAQEDSGFYSADHVKDTRKTPVQVFPVQAESHPEKPVVENPRQENPILENPVQGFPEQVEPILGNPAQLSTYISSKEKERKDLSIHQDGSNEGEGENLYAMYLDRVRENVDYDYLVSQYGEERVDGAVELILEAILTSREKVRIGDAEFPRGLVRNRMLKLDSTHLEYVFDCMDKQTEKIRNIKAYLLKSLFNAPATIDEYYRAEVNHDFRSVAGKREE